MCTHERRGGDEIKSSGKTGGEKNGRKTKEEEVQRIYGPHS